jgi:glycosyltransferase involved in cell wall biosynthesis
MPPPADPPVLGLVLKGYPRISETFISNEIRLLERQGIRVHIFSMRRPRESFCHPSVNEIRARVDYLPETIISRRLPQLLRHNGQLAARRPAAYAHALGLALRRFHRTRKSATLKHLLQAGYLVNAGLARSRIVHLHAHFAHSPTSVAMFSSLLSGRPFSFTAHAKDIYTSDPRQLREKLAMAAFVATCTEYNRRYLLNLGHDCATPIYCFYHGIDLTLFDNPHPRLAPAEPYRILSIARLTPKKGLPTVLKALAHLKQKGVAFDYTLIGDGDDREKILALVNALGLSNRTRWLGTLPHDVVREHYRQADLFALGCEIAANGDRDGIPNVLVESLAMGVPVVATRISALPEIIDHEETGLLVEPGRPDQMAAAMMRALTDRDLRRRAIDAGRHRVQTAFDNVKLIQGLIQVYRAQLVKAQAAGGVVDSPHRNRGACRPAPGPRRHAGLRDYARAARRE